MKNIASLKLLPDLPADNDLINWLDGQIVFAKISYMSLSTDNFIANSMHFR